MGKWGILGCGLLILCNKALSDSKGGEFTQTLAKVGRSHKCHLNHARTETAVNCGHIVTILVSCAKSG